MSYPQFLRIQVFVIKESKVISAPHYPTWLKDITYIEPIKSSIDGLLQERAPKFKLDQALLPQSP